MNITEVLRRWLQKAFATIIIFVAMSCRLFVTSYLFKKQIESNENRKEIKIF